MHVQYKPTTHTYHITAAVKTVGYYCKASKSYLPLLCNINPNEICSALCSFI